MGLAQSQPDWVVGFADETWWSRLAQPAIHTWTADKPLRLVEQPFARSDPDPKALACYGVLLRSSALDERIWLRFVLGRPLSAITIQFLDWCCAQLQALGVRVLCLIWDNAGWHLSHLVRNWLHQHNQQVKRAQVGVRVLVCPLPTKSPWLNPIETQWVHGKQRITEPERLLTVHELPERLCALFHCPQEPLLAIPDHVP